MNNKTPVTYPFFFRASTSSTVIPKMKMFSSPISSLISTLAPSRVPIVRAPFNMNFMLPVPEAYNVTIPDIINKLHEKNCPFCTCILIYNKEQNLP